MTRYLTSARRLATGLSATLLLLLSVTACEKRIAVYTQRSIAADGWEPFDTVMFVIDSLQRDGNYTLSIDLRTTSSFPYQALYLRVEQHWEKPKMVSCDTLCCQLATHNGDITGAGISHLQYTFPLDRLRLAAGQHGHIVIRHIMQREMLPGVASVGVKIERETPAS